jgi:hypothetical protein
VMLRRVRTVGVAAVTVAVCALLGGCGHTDPDEPASGSKARPADSSWDEQLEQDLARMRQWSPAYYICADGWNSYAVGQSGACSWHGGVGKVIYQNRRTGQYAEAVCVASPDRCHYGPLN